MLKKISEMMFGTRHEREMKKLQPYVDQINGLEDTYKEYTDDQLRAKIGEFRSKVENATQNYKDHADLVSLEEQVLAELLPDTFAMVREASIRTLGMRHYDVQLIGGMVLHGGRISEMKTGEGKTLVATLPMVLNALTGRGTHLVTVNDYLATRDSEWMGRIYKFLGFSTGLIVHGLSSAQKRKEYAADIIYGTNNEFGFDYLRDNMKFRLSDYVQRDLHYAIVDEVDSILIDEARTPLIISGQAEDSTDKYYKVNGIIKDLVRLGLNEGKKRAEATHQSIEEMVSDEGGMRAIASSLKGKKKQDLAGDYYYFTIDEKGKTVVLSDEGVQWVEKHFDVDNLYEPSNIEILHHVNKALAAHLLYHREQEYIVKDDRVVIVDEFTGRLMDGRRWSDGLHQAVEAKEGVKIQNENQTMASITFQNYFRMYDKLAGMTGTAETEEAEFKEIYKLDVVAIPTNKPMIRQDRSDLVYKTRKEKYNAVVEEIVERHKEGQPTLVGTISIENSEMLSRKLKKKGVKHNVLNAKFHEQEAEIVAQAGRKGAVTIATNMAGRGTDIVLGGNPEFMAWEKVGREASLEEFEAALEEYQDKCKAEKEFVLEAGGLHILGTERHESRRIDNQLRGRSGRQGDPGSSVFYLSLEDDLMRIFGGDRIMGLMDRIGVEEGQVIEHRMISRAIEKSQKRVEAHHFDIRKNLLEYDTVMNEQRRTIYRQRREILKGSDQQEMAFNAIEDAVLHICSDVCQGGVDKWDFDRLHKEVWRVFGIEVELDPVSFSSKESDALEEVQEKIYFAAEQTYKDKIKFIAEQLGDEGKHWEQMERDLHLEILDKLWREHLQAMDHLREGIGLRSYSSKDPKQEYKKEGFAMFEELLYRISSEFVSYIFRMQIQTESEIEEMQEKRALEREQEQKKMNFGRGEKDKKQKAVTQKRADVKVGRNDPCPCGSGKKFKKCHWGQPGFEQYQ